EWAKGVPLLLSAQIAYARGQIDRAILLAADAANAFDAAHMTLHAAVARGVQGLFKDDEEGAAMHASALSRMREEGIKDPQKFAAVLAPVFARLDTLAAGRPTRVA